MIVNFEICCTDMSVYNTGPENFQSGLISAIAALA